MVLFQTDCSRFAFKQRGGGGVVCVIGTTHAATDVVLADVVLADVVLCEHSNIIF